MGSDSDLPVIREALEILESFEVPFVVRIISAHRTPKQTAEFTKEAVNEGLQVIIAAAGGAAHLAGVIASLVRMPVIGVPMQTKTLSGIDSLYSIVQMPPGVPVATVGINAARNAALLAIQILSLSDNKLAKRFKLYKETLAREVLKKDKKLTEVGWKKYSA